MLPEIITKARERLLVRARFLGSIALWLQWIEAPEVGTMATDGRHVWFCRKWCEAQGVRKIMGVIAHEVLHVVNKHHLRRGKRDSDRWNVAADLVINRLLTDDAYELPSDGLFDHERRFSGLPVETVYLRLEQEEQNQQSGGDDQEHQQGRAGTNSANTTAVPNRTARNSVPANGKTTSPTSGLGDDDIAPAKHWGEVRDLTDGSGKTLTQSDLRQAEHDLDVVIRQAAAAAKRAGQYSGALHEIVEASLDRVDWRDRLRTLFDGTLRSDASWSRPNRRYVQHGTFLPGWQRTGPGTVAFVLDTSGSISAQELALYSGNLLGVIEETGHARSS
jgi:predicted metal-dependent peptidase